jgi:hypothetical protein
VQGVFYAEKECCFGVRRIVAGVKSRPREARRDGVWLERRGLGYDRVRGNFSR